ncbi:hypothetical protein DOS84_14305 [Flavobacterium aquariorum]|uniref:Ig-like domain-containing protein n=1 Tax=Flavobacterium aquariorum TaxID=2217670 RepID=A0A2W7TTA5_9FLAO|nr:gliding motility-associated C-terminal domain-containing protein [Flavobacterium aquariorum]PZX92626.1 hypothetical protein DOS84_14305 [Flavobacterium aquariorum]
MVPKLRLPTCFTFYSFFTFLILFFCSIDVNAQCAGIAGSDNNTLNVCDIANSSSISVDLNAQLGPHTLGGTWSDDDKSLGLNTTTGILNAQQIKKSGIYNYTYTVSDGLGCTDSAVITVTIGGYSGIAGPDFSVCNNQSLNLFMLFKGVPTPSPQTNGTWNDDSGSGGLSGNTLNTAAPPSGNTYPYTYTVSSPLGSTCNSSVSSTVNVSIFRGPESGTPTNLQLCSDVLGTYTNFDLFGQLSGEDIGGVWTDAGLGEITSATDSNINIQNIYNTRGPGVYRFTYTVLSNYLVCSDKSSFVDITIEKQLDFTGATLVVNPDICENEIPTASYSAVLTQGAQAITNGSYVVTYTISGVATPIQTTQNFSGGVLTFPILSAYFQQVNNYTVNIINIKDATSLGICNNIIGTIEDVLHIHPIPKINNATLTIVPVCQTFDASVNFSGTSNLTDGNYDIIYNLSGSNSLNGIPASLNVVGGLSTFIIPKALIPNAGTNTITITKITNTTTGCTNTSTLNKSFTINPLPNASNLVATIKNLCQGQDASIKLSGLGTLTDITINYNLFGVNSVGTKNIPLTVVAGETSFVIPATDIPNIGLTSFTITNLTNTVTGCTLSINNKTDFTVNSIPAIPVTNDIQSFCTADNATVVNLNPQGNQYQWFDSAVSTVPLTTTTPLITDDYFVKEVNLTTGCESSLKSIDVIINTTPQINNVTLTIVPVCPAFDALVDFSGTSNLTDGNYDIVYNISGNNTATAISTVINITGGLGTFTIPKALIPNAGTSTITITKITNSITGCTNTSTLNKSFTVNPLPDATNLTATIKDICQGQATNVKLSGLGTLTSISINYNLSGVNISSSQSITLTVVAGETNFVIPTTDIPNVGLTSFTITNLTNAVTGCTLAINNKTDFTVNSIPAIPVANDQIFCTSDNATVANLIPQGSQYQWFDSATSSVPLISSKPLVSGNYFVKEVNVLTGCESSIKSIIVQINTTPQINSATLTIAPICQGYSANVNFSGNSNLTDGNYNILYNLSGSNIATAIPATLSINSGLATFSIASNLIPNSGNTTIVITNITNVLTNCTNTSTLSKVFIVNGLPDIANMVVTVKDGCLGQAVNVDITGLGTLSNITLSYAVSGANAIGSQTIPLAVSEGKTLFLIPAGTLLNTGNNTLVITDLTNTGNGCSITINTVSKSFAINAIPDSPTASNQKFCETNLATVANLAPNGNQYKWYDTPTSTTPLASNKLLVTGNYYVKEMNASTGCESISTPISVLINTVQRPDLKANGEEFCGIDKPSIQNLSNNTIASTNLAWYDAITNGTIIPNTDLLSEGATYYGFDYDATTQCYSSALSVTVSLTKCSLTPDKLKIPDGFSPNGDGVNDTFQIVDIEFSFPNYTLEIFNRYGNVLFKGDINKPDWNGKNSNSSFIDGDAPAGVYFYIIHYNKDNLPPKQGQLYLNR